MSYKPNKNGDLEDCLALMVMSAENLVFEIEKQINKKNYEIGAILLRSLLEINANIKYIYASSSKTLPTRFLKTAELTSKNLFALKNKEKPLNVSWAKKSIVQRVSALGEDELAMYKFLSSYAHSDAGFMAGYSLGYRKKLGPVFLAVTADYLWDIIDNLSEFGVIRKKDLEKQIYRTMKHRLPELKR